MPETYFGGCRSNAHVKQKPGTLRQAFSCQHRRNLVASETCSFWFPSSKQDEFGSFVVASSAGQLRHVPGSATPVMRTLLLPHIVNLA